MPVAKAYAKASAADRGGQGLLRGGGRRTSRSAWPTRSSTRPSSSPCGSGSIRSTRTRWSGARSLLPHGTGKTVRVIVFAKGEKEREAREAGADIVGAEDLVEKIQGGWLEFDTAVATPDLMGAGGAARQGAGPARAHAEPQGRDRDVRRRPGHPGGQGRQGRVQGGQGRQRARARRQALLRGRRTWRRTPARSSKRW